MAKNPEIQEEQQRRARGGSARHRAQKLHAAAEHHEQRKHHEKLQHARGHLTNGDADAIVDQNGAEACHTAFEAPAERREKREQAAHQGFGTHGGEARAADQRRRQQADGNAHDLMRIQGLLEENTAQNRTDRAVQRGDGHDHAGVSRRRGGIQADDVGDGGERTANRSAHHHDQARLALHGLPKITQLAVFRAHEHRPDAADQIIDAGGKRSQGKRDDEGAQRRLAIAPFGTDEPFAPYALRFRQGQKARVKTVANARCHGEGNASHEVLPLALLAKRGNTLFHGFPLSHRDFRQKAPKARRKSCPKPARPLRAGVPPCEYECACAAYASPCSYQDSTSSSRSTA